MLKGLKVLDRWNLVSLLPEKGGLHTQLIVQKLREKLLMDADEVEELGLTTGVIHEECGNPVQNIGSESEPKYHCLVCDKVITDTKGSPGQTIWNAAKDVGVDIELKKAERGIFIEVFAELDKGGEVTPQHVAVWNLLEKGYPKAFTPPDNDDEEEE